MMRFDPSFSGPPEHVSDLPDAADLVVIGGGVIGVMTAWYACQQGLSVVLLEKGRIACEQSSRNWGWVRQQGRHLAELPLAMEALRLWPELQDELQVELGFRRKGVMYIATSEKAEAEHESWLNSAKPFGVDTQWVTKAQLADHFPHVDARWRSALLTPSDGRAEPWIAVPTVARALASKGAIIREHCAVRCLEMQAGQMTGVVTEAGRIKTTRAVLAGGAWSSLFLGNHGIRIPQLSVRATVAATTPLPDMAFAGGAEDGAVAWRKRLDGGYSLAQGEFHEFFIGPDAFRNFFRYIPIFARDLTRTRLLPAAPAGYPDGWATARKWEADEQSPFERMRVLNPIPNKRRLLGFRSDFQDRFPSLGPVEFQQTWAGMIDVLPDDIPILDEVPDVPGLILATGMCGHGFGIGPAMGNALAKMAMGKPTGHDLSAFRFGRF